MLKRLHIVNIAIIEKVEIEFMPGLCVLSGETGAGKSIIIDSLNAVSGARVSREIIRSGENSASVSALFENVPDLAVKTAAGMGIDVPDGAILLSRDIFASGHNSCHINGQPATLQMLKTIATILINIHGQHDGLHLLDEENHIDYLDDYTNSASLLREYQVMYDDLLSLNRQIKTLSLSETDKNRRLDEIEKLISALEKADIKPDEWTGLNLRRTRLYSEQKTSDAINTALQYIESSDDSMGIYDSITAACKSLGTLKESVSADEIIPTLNDAASLVSDVSVRLSDMLAKLEYTPELLNDTEKRMDDLESLALMCSCSPDRLDKVLQSLYDEQGSLIYSESNIDVLKEKYAEKRAQLVKCASDLHNVRESSAKELSLRMEKNLAFLNMPNARFSVEIVNMSKFGRKGTDEVRFLFTANKGEDLKPLAKVASGGELSRLMLSFKNIITNSDNGAVAVFDEIDTGVSGKAASRVAQMLSSIGKERQVLCVTHLPQIACAADNQYRISKQITGNRTVTSVEILSDNGRIDELCRLIGGEHITEATRQSAAQMIAQARSATGI